VTHAVLTFCADLAFSDSASCWYLPSTGFGCPDDYVPPTCLAWYELDTQTGYVIAVQILALLGVVVALVNLVVGCATMAASTRREKHRAAAGAAASSLTSSVLALAVFVVALNFPYFQGLLRGDGRAYVVDPTSPQGWELTPPDYFARAPHLQWDAAFGASVSVFVMSFMSTILFYTASRSVARRKRA